MTLNEFKAWLEGFDAAFANGAPNADQWAKILKKLDEVSPHVVSTPYPFRTKPVGTGPMPYWQNPVTSICTCSPHGGWCNLHNPMPSSGLGL